jgi:hypothetical protein
MDRGSQGGGQVLGRVQPVKPYTVYSTRPPVNSPSNLF